LPAIASPFLGHRCSLRGGPVFGVHYTLTLNARTGNPLPTYEITLSPGTQVHTDQDFEFNGGSIGGSGTLQVERTLNVGGKSTTDKPILGCLLNLGDGTTVTVMGYSNNTVPLVVKDFGNITLNNFATLDFGSCGTVTAISNGDTGTHTITVAGGRVLRSNGAEMFVAMGVTVNSGSLEVSGAGLGPFHITERSAGPGNGGLVVNGGSVQASSSLSVDQGIFIDGGIITVGTNATLTSGQNGAPATFYVTGGQTLLRGRLETY
jgi:hypothetical protein